MHIRFAWMLFLASTLVSTAGAQGIMSDLMSGKLVNPEVGAFAWYNLTDSATGKQFFLRQAIVADERVNRKDAYWLETELVPKVGYPTVYKMLLTGPASDPDNVHRLIIREGTQPPQEIEIDQSRKPEEATGPPRKSLGVETVSLPDREVLAERFAVGRGEAKTEIWVSEEVRPMGLVRMKSPEGELILQRFGVGGKDGASAIPDALKADDEEAEEREEKKKPRRNFFGGRRNR